MAATGGAADANAERRKPRHFAVAGRDTFTKRSREDHQFALSAPPGGELVPDLRACAGTGSGRGRMIAAPGSIRSRSIFDTPPTRRGRVPLACGSGVLVGTSPNTGRAVAARSESLPSATLATNAVATQPAGREAAQAPLGTSYLQMASPALSVARRRSNDYIDFNDYNDCIMADTWLALPFAILTKPSSANCACAPPIGTIRWRTKCETSCARCLLMIPPRGETWPTRSAGESNRSAA